MDLTKEPDHPRSQRIREELPYNESEPLLALKASNHN